MTEGRRRKTLSVTENTLSMIADGISTFELFRLKLRAQQEGRFEGDIVNEMQRTIDEMAQIMVMVGAYLSASQENAQTNRLDLLESDANPWALMSAMSGILKIEEATKEDAES